MRIRISTAASVLSCSGSSYCGIVGRGCLALPTRIQEDSSAEPDWTKEQEMQFIEFMA